LHCSVAPARRLVHCKAINRPCLGHGNLVIKALKESQG
jgi:hypothetical protein